MRQLESNSAAALDLAYTSLLLRILRALGRAGIAVMPLKGVLFAYWLYEQPADRLGGDIDLLVPEAEFQRAVAVLKADGFEPAFTYFNGRECTLTGQPPIEIDLHRALFALGRFRLSTADLFSRGREDRLLYSEVVVLPDPYDAYAHVIGHAAADHVPSLPVRTKEDLTRLVARFQLDPVICAGRLDAHGLGRAARYVHGFDAAENPFAKELLAALRPDHLGRSLAAAARTLTGRSLPASLASRAAGFLTNSSLPDSAFAVSVALWNRVRMSLGRTPI